MPHIILVQLGIVRDYRYDQCACKYLS